LELIVEHYPIVQPGQVSVNRPPHCSHHLLSASMLSRVLVRKSARSKSAGMGFGPASGISVGSPRPLTRTTQSPPILSLQHIVRLFCSRLGPLPHPAFPHLPGEDLHSKCPHISRSVPMKSTV
jgi:hypothetical protein